MPAVAIQISVVQPMRTGLSSRFTDGTETWRIQARNGELCFDYALTPTAFAGTEDTDWYSPLQLS